MKKKLIYLILGLLAAASVTIGFAGCSGNPEDSSSAGASSAASSEDSASQKTPFSETESTVSTGLAKDGLFVDSTGTIQIRIPEGYEAIPSLSTDSLATFQNPADQTALSVTWMPGATAQDLSQQDFEKQLSMTYQSVNIENFKKEKKDGATSYRYKLSASSGTTKVQVLQYTSYSPDHTVSVALAGPDTTTLSQEIFDTTVQSLQTLK